MNSFSNLSYRREIIYNKNKLLIINDSKSTSFSSSVNLLKNYKNIYWILGGISKKGDLLKLNSVFKKKIKAYIYGKDIKFFKDKLKNTFYVKTFKNLKNALEQVIRDTTNDSDHKSIIFSPSAASFDQFKNFEERGKYFNNILKKLNFIKKIIYEK